ncbi:MAG: hypothetical protein DMG11_19750 [Acidobacteria bacterium]|nr:MAG: hypothetical protein DMG11_19750 [Acidobacteriota bacterium]
MTAYRRQDDRRDNRSREAVHDKENYRILRGMSEEILSPRARKVPRRLITNLRSFVNETAQPSATGQCVPPLKKQAQR